MGDIKHIQSLNSWENKQVGGVEIIVNNFNNLELFTESIYEKIPYNLNAQSIKEKSPQIFDWLDLQDINVRVSFNIDAYSRWCKYDNSTVNSNIGANQNDWDIKSIGSK